MSVTETVPGLPATDPGRKPPRLARRRRAGRAAGASGTSVLLNILMTVMLLYALLPLFWLVVNSTKTQGALFSTFGLWFGGKFALWSNIHQVFTYDNGVFVRWLGNTLLYVVAGPAVPRCSPRSPGTGWPSTTSPASASCSPSCSARSRSRPPRSRCRPSCCSATCT